MTRLLVRRKNSQLHFRIIILFTLLFSVFITSCIKSPEKIGAEIMPENSKIKVAWTDTSTVYAYSTLVDSIRTDEVVYNYLGSIVDPVFGSTIAGFYTEFLLSSVAGEQDPFGPNPQLDSLVLQLAYRGYYGDTNTTLVVHAYEMQELMNIEDEYYSNHIFQTGAEDYMNYSFLPHPNDSTQVIDTVAGDTNMYGAVQRFDLSSFNPGLGMKLLSADSLQMSSSTDFRNFFNGLFVITEPISSDGSLLRFDLTDAKSGLIIYYSNDTADSLAYGYTISSFTPRVNRYEHNYLNADAEFKSQVIDGDTALGQTKFYAQGLAGVRSVIKFPYLREWSRLGNYGINEAKLIFSGFEAEPYLGEPYALLLVKAKEDGTGEILEDQWEGESFFGGTYNSGSREYVFRITNHLQNLIADSSLTDYGLYMYVNSGSINPRRMIFNGNLPSSDTVSPFRLEMVVSDLNDH